jgi:hypothetical protein
MARPLTAPLLNQGIQISGVNAPIVSISNLAITNTKAVGGGGQNAQNGYYSGGLAYGAGGGNGGVAHSAAPVPVNGGNGGAG